MRQSVKVQFVTRQDGEIVERGNTYDVISISHGWYRIDDGYLYPPQCFDIVDSYPTPPTEETPGLTSPEDDPDINTEDWVVEIV